MRPLNRTVPSRHDVLLDEEATVNRIADERLWFPVFKPAPERWLDLALVVDRYESMSIWRRPVAELQGLLERLGAFNDVRLWMLDQDPDQPGSACGGADSRRCVAHGNSCTRRVAA